MSVVTLADGIPAELTQASPTPPVEDPSRQICEQVVKWRNTLRTRRHDKMNIWNECWQLYRGQEDFSDKEDWQSKIVLPKSWSAVKQATNTVKRLLYTSQRPWTIEAVNQDDIVQVLRADKLTKLVRVFADKARMWEEFAEGLECGFIIGLGVWKVWWGLVPRKRRRVATVPIQAEPAPLAEGNLLVAPNPYKPTGIPGQATHEFPVQENRQYPTQLPGEALLPTGWPGAGFSGVTYQRQLIEEEVLEGQLFVRAVDPYNFYWLPGSKLNRWTGTIEEIDVPYWELVELADKGVFDKEIVAKIQPSSMADQHTQTALRFSEPQRPGDVSKETSNVRITEYYGPVFVDGKLVEKYGHVMVANDSHALFPGGWKKNELWEKEPPYVGFSPLALPFRTEGVGLVEMGRELNKALSRLANLSIDTLLYRLLPVFEVVPEFYENSEDFEAGLYPGKIFRRNQEGVGMPGITPIGFEDVSGGAVQVAAQLDRSHQEASLVSEIQESIPRWRGDQTATEVQIKAENQNSFFGAMAADIEAQAIKPMVEKAMDLVLQFIDTANDPRVASILGVDAQLLAGMTREELLEMVQGDYIVKVAGISEQLEKVEMLQNLVQLMNLIGQNPEAWLPYVNQDELLRRILEAFRPAIRDIEHIVADPQTAAGRMAAMQNEQLTPDLLRILPQLAESANRIQLEKQQAAQNAELEEEKLRAGARRAA